MTSTDPSPAGTGPSLLSSEALVSLPRERIHNRSILTESPSLCSADALDRYGSVRSMDRRPPHNYDVYEGLDRYESIRSTHPLAECSETRYARAVERNPDLDRYASLATLCTPRPQTDQTLTGDHYRVVTATPMTEPERDPPLCNVLTTAIKDEFGRPWTLISFQPVVPEATQELVATDTSAVPAEESGVFGDHSEHNQTAFGLPRQGSAVAHSASTYRSARACTRTTISSVSSVSLDVYSNTEGQSFESGQVGSAVTVTGPSSLTSEEVCDASSLPTEKDALPDSSAVTGSDGLKSSVTAWPTQGSRRSTFPVFLPARSSGFRDLNRPSANAPLQHDGESSDLTPIVLYEASELLPSAPVQRSPLNTNRSPLAMFNPNGATFGSTERNISNIQSSQVSTTRPLLLHSKPPATRWDSDLLLVLCASLNVLLFTAFAGVVFSYFLYSGMTPDAL